MAHTCVHNITRFMSLLHGAKNHRHFTHVEVLHIQKRERERELTISQRD